MTTIKRRHIKMARAAWRHIDRKFCLAPFWIPYRKCIERNIWRCFRAAHGRKA